MSIKSKQNIITLVAGGTGGHIYPALAILYEIKKTNKVIFITDERGNNYLLNEKDLINQSNFEIIIINAISPFKKGLINKFKEKLEKDLIDLSVSNESNNCRVLNTEKYPLSTNIFLEEKKQFDSLREKLALEPYVFKGYCN